MFRFLGAHGLHEKPIVPAFTFYTRIHTANRSSINSRVDAAALGALSAILSPGLLSGTE